MQFSTVEVTEAQFKAIEGDPLLAVVNITEAETPAEGKKAK